MFFSTLAHNGFNISITPGGTLHIPVFFPPSPPSPPSTLPPSSPSTSVPLLPPLSVLHPPPPSSPSLLLECSLDARQCPKCFIWTWCHLIITFYTWGTSSSKKQNNLPTLIELLCWQCSDFNSVLWDATGCAQCAMVMLPVHMCYVNWASGWRLIIAAWLENFQFFSTALLTTQVEQYCP